MSSGQQSQQFCVRWNSHLGSIGAAFPQLLAGQRFVDVTLACEGHQVHCHRLVLAACSTFFENLLGENPCKHPIIILPREIKLWAIQALVDFMYKGEVNVSQAGLPDLMKCAEILKIRGLCGSDAALNLNQITSPGGGSSSSSGSSSAGNSSAQQRESSNQSGQRGTSPQRVEKGKGQQNSALSGTTTKTGGAFLETLNTNPVASSTPTKVPSQQQLQQQPNLHQSGDDGDNSDNGGSGSEMCIKTEDLIIDEDIGKGGEDEEEMEMEGNDKMQAEDVDEDEDEDIEEYIENQFGEEAHNSNSNEFTITITDECSASSQKAATQARPQAKPSSTSPPPSSSSSLLSILTRGSIRVKSNENLFENYKHQQDHKEENKSASKHVYSQYGDDGGGDGVGDRDVDGGTGLPSSLVYNRNTMDIYVKSKKGGTSTASNPDVSLEEAGSETSADGYENIICSPNFPQLSRSSMMSFQEDDYDEDFDIQILPDDSSMTNGDSDTGGDDDLVYPPPLLPFGNSETSITRVPSGKSSRSYGGPGLASARKQVRQSSGRGGKSGTRQSRETKPAVANGIAIAPSAFILRNPRGNQPRSYNTDALWKALMDVKAGESIYRASQIHKVPRKTLRNWMKRWDIKSAYPMPRQLKEAAEKKRIIKELTEQAQQLSDELTH